MKSHSVIFLVSHIMAQFALNFARSHAKSIVGALLLVVCFSTLANAATFVVTKTADTNDGACDADCSLREALAVSGNVDSISFSPLFNTQQTISLLNALPDITTSISIQGPGANLLTVRRSDTAGDFRIFNIPGSGLNIAISGMTISNGRAINGFGGGIYSTSNLMLTNCAITNNESVGNTVGGGGVLLAFADGAFTNCTFSGNAGGVQGGGIDYHGDGGFTLRMVNCTVSGNRANGAGLGGGISHGSVNGNSTVELVNSTIAGNTANNSQGNSAGGIYTVAINGGSVATTTLRNSIIANNAIVNLRTSFANNGTPIFTSQGFNLSSDNGGGFLASSGDQINQNPLLGPLTISNGGTTPTHALLLGSPALDKGNSSGSSTDQRGVGFTRPVDLLIANASGGDGSDIGAFEAQTAPQSRQLFDYDGDGRSDLSVRRPADNIWYILRGTAGYFNIEFGVTGDLIAPADYDGDGKTDVCVFRPSNGTWYTFNSQSQSFSTVGWGANGDLPVPADHDGDGRADLVVFRPSTNTWYTRFSLNNSFSTVGFGVAGDKPVVGDFDGDGKADISLYRPSDNNWYILKTGFGFFVQTWGVAGDIPVPADYDGDGKTDVAVFRSSTGQWFRIQSTAGFDTVNWGVNGDRPIPADYDGDGKSDVAVFRPSNATWYIVGSTSGQLIQNYGVAGDLPTQGAFIY
ncbi:MAG: FG-GAP-like repeat-containing protein [Pyrinomonadaceae bacterium]